MLALGVQPGPVFMTYMATREIDELSGVAAASEPEYDFTAPDGVRHTFWVVDDADRVAGLTEAFGRVPRLYIADGHHRVSVASIVAGRNVGLPAEGSHLRKINGKYYLSMITWPRGGMRTQLVFRSDTLTGPYEGKVALQYEGIAQGGLIDTPEGEWYALLFQDHGAVGRIPFLVPVTWKEGWPDLGVEGRVPRILNIRSADSGLGNIVMSDEFTRSAGQRELPLAWQWNHNPVRRCWSLAARSGYLRLAADRVVASLVEAPNSLTQRTFGPVCSGTVAVDVSGMKDGDCAGLAMLQRKYGYVGIMASDTKKSVVMVGVPSRSPQRMESVPFDGETIFLKVECDYRNRTDKAYFYYSLDGKKWSAIGEPLQPEETLLAGPAGIRAGLQPLRGVFQRYDLSGRG